MQNEKQQNKATTSNILHGQFSYAHLRNELLVAHIFVYNYFCQSRASLVGTENFIAVYQFVCAVKPS